MAELRVMNGGALDSNRQFFDDMRKTIDEMEKMPGVVTGFVVAITHDDGWSDTTIANDPAAMVMLLERIKIALVLGVDLDEDDDEK